jgi:hypothetical protein
LSCLQESLSSEKRGHSILPEDGVCRSLMMGGN